jgi:DNA ligase (NAD+)
MFQEINFPTNCPSCDNELEWVNDSLYCRNHLCPAQNAKAVEHFAKTIKIKGLGPASIKKLGWTCPSEIYLTSDESILRLLGSKKVALKLIAEIQNSKSAPLELVLPAFGIPLIGKTATLKLSETISNITEINADTCERAGLGPKATNNLLDWMRKDFYGYFDGVLPFNYKFSNTTPPAVSKGMVCISGRLKSFKSKADATTALNMAGYEVKSSLTKQVDFLINEGGAESAKTRQARQTGVTIVTDLRSFLEN